MAHRSKGIDGRTASAIERSSCFLGEVRNDGVVDLQQRAKPFGAERHLFVQRSDFFIGFHVGGGQRHLACHFTQQLRIRFGILVRLAAPYAERADALSLQDQRSETIRPETCLQEAPLNGILPFGRDIAAKERPLVVEHPAVMAVLSVHLGAHSEVVQAAVRFQRDDAQSVPVRLI